MPTTVADGMEQCDQVQSLIGELTNRLKKYMDSGENIVIAAHAMIDNMRRFKNVQCSKFWDDQVVPNLTKILTQDVKVRSIVANFLSHIRNLSICIQENAEMIKSTKGSSGGIQVAQKVIYAALDTLEKFKKEASDLNLTRVMTVADDIGKIHKHIMSKVTIFETQQNEINIRLEEYHKELDELDVRRYGQQSLEKIKRLSKVMQDTKDLIQNVHNYLEQIGRSTEELTKLNQIDEQRIESIRNKVPRTIIEECDCRGLCHKIHAYTITEECPKAAARISHLQHLVKERAKEIQTNHSNKRAQKEFLNNLSCQLNTYKDEYNADLEEFKSSDTSNENRSQRIRRDIDTLSKDLTNIENQAASFKYDIDQTLLDRLIHITTLNENLHRESSMGPQIVSILNTVTKPLEDSLSLLLNGNETDAYHATKRLQRYAAFLFDYWTSTSSLLQPSSQYSGLAMAVSRKTC